MTVLLIRANRNEVDALELAAVGVTSLVDPYLEISGLSNHDGADRMLSAIESAEGNSVPTWLVVTSTNALECFERLLEPGSLGRAIRNTEHLKFAAIGEMTAEQLLDRGADQVLTPRGFNPMAKVDSQSLADLLCQTPAGIAVIPSGSLAMEGLSRNLIDHGFEVVSELVYQTREAHSTPSSVSKIQQGQIEAVLLRSPSAARAFVRFNGLPRNIKVFCAGQTTASQVRELGLVVTAVSDDPSPLSVARTIAQHMNV